MAQTTHTIDHQEIKEWVEEHGGSPAAIEGTYDGFGSGILRIDWGKGDEALDQLSWEDFFRVFDDNDLAFVYEMNDGEGDSFSCKFEARSTGASQEDDSLYADSDTGFKAEDVSDDF